MDRTGAPQSDAPWPFVPEFPHMRGEWKSPAKTIALSALGSLLAMAIAGAAVKVLSSRFQLQLYAIDPPELAFSGFEGAVFLVQFVLSLLAVLYLRRSDLEDKLSTPATDIGLRVFRQFLAGWTWIWIAWCSLYGWLSVAWLASNVDAVSNHGHLGLIVWSIADIANLGGGIAFFWCFYVLDVPSVTTKGAPTRDELFRTANRTALLAGSVALVLSVADYYGQPSFFNRIGNFCLVNYVALSMLFLFGRLDSPFLRIRRSLIGLFYLYAVIQVLWMFFGDLGGAGIFRNTLFFVSMPMKVILFVVIHQSMSNGSISQFIVREAKERGE